MRKRLFIAINVSPEIKRALGQCRDRSVSDGAKWVNPENFHLTLCFLGSTDINLIPPIAEKLREISGEFSRFAVEFDRVDLAPPGKHRQTMVWAYFFSNAAYGDLSARVNEELMKVHTTLRPERKKAIPHITLARFKKAGIAQRVRLVQPARGMRDIDAQSIDLMESELGSTGSKYTLLESFSLQ